MAIDDLVVREDFALEEVVDLCIKYLEGNPEHPKTIGAFFDKYDPIARKFVPTSKHGPLNKYINRFQKDKGKGRLPKGVLTFEDWIKHHIPPTKWRRLKTASDGCMVDYTLEEGVEFYVRYLQKDSKRKLGIRAFFDRYDPLSGVVLDTRKHGRLNKHLRKFPKEEKIEDWLKSQIPPRLMAKLERVGGRYLNGYSIEQGVEYYIHYLEDNPRRPITMRAFFDRYNPESASLFPDGEHGAFNKYLNRFQQARKKGILPKGVLTFEDWVMDQIPSRTKCRLEMALGNHMKVYSIEQGVEFYVQYLQKDSKRKLGIRAFFDRYDPVSGSILGIGNHGKLSRYLHEYLRILNAGKISSAVTFEEWVKNQVSPSLLERLSSLLSKYLPQYPLAMGVDLYIDHVKKYDEESKSAITFFGRFDVLSGKIGLTTKGTFYKYLIRFERAKEKKRLPKGVNTFIDYLISQLPPERRPTAEYYLKRQYLKDLARQKIDAQRLKSVIMEG